MKPRRSFGSKQPNAASNNAAFASFLVTARSLDGMTPEYLARIYRVDAREAECKLSAEKAKRAREGRS